MQHEGGTSTTYLVGGSAAGLLCTGSMKWSGPMPDHAQPGSAQFLKCASNLSVLRCCFVCDVVVQEVADKVIAWIQLQVDSHSRHSLTA